MPAPATDFFPRLPAEARILVLDLGFLGDTIHLIPALAAIRRAKPKAKLEVMVAEHVQSILAVCPWLDTVSGYPRFPKGPKWHQDLGRAWKLHARHFDAVINLNGSDRSSILTRLTGAPLRLGRKPPKVSRFWPHCFTHTVFVPHGRQPLYLQRLDALAAAGFPGTADGPFFPIVIPAAVSQRVAEKLGADRPYLHISPFATADEKELPVQVLAELLNQLASARSDLALVLSTAPNERERAKLQALLGRLQFAPWKVFAGDLSLVELAEVMRRARLHLGGDSGALHVALLAGTPTFSWWRDYEDRLEWMPAGSTHAAAVGRASPQGLEGITATTAADAVLALLSKIPSS